MHHVDIHAALQKDINLLQKLFINTLQKEQAEEIIKIIAIISPDINNFRKNPQQTIKHIQQTIKTLTNNDILLITRAFFHLLNLTDIAEKEQRIVCRQWHKNNNTPQAGSLEDILPKLLDKGISTELLYETISNLKIELVLTAHPTEVIRRTLMHKYSQIATDLYDLTQTNVSLEKQHAIINRLQKEIDSLWHIEEIRQKKPTVIDEARWGFAVVKESLWHAIPQFMHDLDKVLYKTTNKHLPIDATPIRFASWQGGDRDGNPNVIAKITREVVFSARWMAADLYWHDVHSLKVQLASHIELFSAKKQEFINDLFSLLQAIETKLVATKIWAEYSIEHQQNLLTQEKYLEKSDFINDLFSCYNMLCSLPLNEQIHRHLINLMRRAHCFGLCLLPLDIRQHAYKHVELMNAITQQLGIGYYNDWDELTRQQFLRQHLTPETANWLPDDLTLPKEFQEYFDTFKLIAELPTDAFGCYIISMTANASDVLLPFALQLAVKVRNPLPVVPLFETLTDLNNASSCLEKLLSIVEYKKACNGMQEIMIGYSDSAKDAGILAASWAQYKAQEELLAVGKRHNIKITFFHGRGGSVGRGGGPTHLVIRSQPPGTIQGQIRITQQGEIIRHRFGLPKIAERTLEIYTTATLEATLFPTPPPENKWRIFIDNLAQVSANAYQNLVKRDLKFTKYFHIVTPINESDKLTITSRPNRRNSGEDIDSLRAIPWSFAWMQNRFLFPSWFSIGEALEYSIDNFGINVSREIAKNWLYLSSILNIAEMTLAKSEPDIFAEYERELVQEDLWPIGAQLQGSFLRTQTTLSQILQNTDLLKDKIKIDSSIRARNPYLVPLHLIQIELLKRYRNNNKLDKQLERALLISMVGIVAGMHNAG